MFVLLATLSASRNTLVTLDDALYLGNSAARGGVSIRGLAFAFTSVSTLYWHPLAWLSHELDAELFGANAAGHHFTSVHLHAIAAGFLFLVLRRLGARDWAAAGGALLWALHPLRVESFAWVAERKDVLCAMFFIATVLAYLRYAELRSMRRYAAWIALAALALMSKPVAVSLAPILLLSITGRFAGRAASCSGKRRATCIWTQMDPSSGSDADNVRQSKLKTKK